MGRREEQHNRDCWVSAGEPTVEHVVGFFAP